MSRLNIRVTEFESTSTAGRIEGRAVVVVGTCSGRDLGALLAAALRDSLSPEQPAAPPAPRGAQWKRESRTRRR